MRMRSLIVWLSVCLIGGASWSQPIFVDSPPAGSALVISGAAPSDEPETGHLVRTLGDFTGGAADPEIAISLPFAEPGSLFEDTVVILPGEETRRGVINLSNPLASGAIHIQGPPGSGFGANVAAIGDFDRDGYYDFAIGAPFAGEGGRIYVIKGDPFIPSRLDVASPESEERILLRIDGQPGDMLGFDLGKGGDFNGNGYSDLVIPDPFAFHELNEQPTIGAAHIVLTTSALFGSAIQVPDFDSEHILTLLPPPNPEDEDAEILVDFGAHIESIGDFTGDGFDDIALFGGFSTGSPGKAVIHIFTGGIFSPGVYRVNEAPFNRIDVEISLFSRSLMHRVDAIAGADLNRDGRNELILGFSRANAVGETGFTGAVLVIPSPETPTPFMRIDSLEESRALLLNHWQPNSLFGSVIASSAGMLATAAPNMSSPLASSNFRGGVYVFQPSSLHPWGLDARPAASARSIYYGISGEETFDVHFDFIHDMSGDGYPEIFIASGGDENQPDRVGWILPSRPIPGDLNADGRRDIRDLFIYSTFWKQAGVGQDSLIHLIKGLTLY